jgi:transcriptional regulator
MTQFTDQEIVVGKLKRQGKRHKEIAKELGWSREQVESVIKSMVAKINTVNDSIDFLTAIGQLSGEKVIISHLLGEKHD